MTYTVMNKGVCGKRKHSVRTYGDYNEALDYSEKMNRRTSGRPFYVIPTSDVLEDLQKVGIGENAYQL